MNKGVRWKFEEWEIRSKVPFYKRKVEFRSLWEWWQVGKMAEGNDVGDWLELLSFAVWESSCVWILRVCGGFSLHGCLLFSSHASSPYGESGDVKVGGDSLLRFSWACAAESKGPERERLMWLTVRSWDEAQEVEEKHSWRRENSAARDHGGQSAGLRKRGSECKWGNVLVRRRIF